MKQLFLLICLSLVLIPGFELQAQVKTPAPSPMCTVTQDVGLSKVTIEYSRPGVKGRDIFGGLVPYGKMWRTGANGSTDITFSDEVMINGTTLEAGKYALYTIPGEKKWEIILHTKTDYWGIGQEYDEANDALRLTVPAHHIDFTVETMTIIVDNIHHKGANILFMWENTLVTIPFEFGTHEMVMETIESTMSGPSANDYYSAGRYLYESKTDMSKAHEYVSKATAMRPDAFWMLRTQSEIEADMGDYEQAIMTAKKSKEMAMKAENPQYVKYNEENIEKWSKM